MRLPISVSLNPRESGSAGWLVSPGSDELCLLELQGSLEPDPEDVAAGATVPGAHVGTLDLSVPVRPLRAVATLRRPQSRPTLRIGHHLLTGAQVKLDKPLAILRHTLPAASSANDDHGDPASEDGLEEALRAPSDRPTKRLKETIEEDNARASSSSPNTFRHAQLNRTPRPQALTAAGLLGENITASSSPLPRAPPTPVSVADLRGARHEIIGLVRTKLIFSKRPVR